MRVKYNGETINIANESLTPKKEFLNTNWNYYYISITKEKLRSWNRDYGYAWYIQLVNPTGTYNYDGYYKNTEGTYEGTLSEALQDCFDNVDIPLIPIGGYADDIDEEDFRSEMRY